MSTLIVIAFIIGIFGIVFRATIGLAKIGLTVVMIAIGVAVVAAFSIFSKVTSPSSAVPQSTPQMMFNPQDPFGPRIPVSSESQPKPQLIYNPQDPYGPLIPVQPAPAATPKPFDPSHPYG